MKHLSQLLDSNDDSMSSSDRRIRQERLAASIRRLRELLEDVLGSGNDRAFVEALNTLGRNRIKIEEALIAWIDLIEELVQEAEIRYGTQPGRGSLKASEVKAVVRYLLKSRRVDLTSLPRFIEDALVDAAVDWMIDAVVVVLNENDDLWEASDPAPESYRARLRLLVHQGVALLRPLWLPVLALVVRFWNYLRYSPPLSARLKALADAVRERGLVMYPDDVVEAAVSGVIWVGDHRGQIVGGFQLIAAAVQEAEYVGSLQGQEKKVYARDLIFAVLDELGYYVRSGLPFAIVDAIIDAGIEAAVHLFHKREVFQ